MKKLFSLLTIISSLLITSCQKGIDTFKDHYVNYSFSKYADDKKVDALYAGMSLGRQQLSSISTKHQIYQTSTNSVISENTESEVVIKEDKNNPDYLILETKETIENSSSKNGITIVDQIKKVVKEWDGGSGYFHNITKTTTNGEEQEKRSSKKMNNSSSKYKEIYLRDSVAIPYKDKTFYLDSNGTYKVIVQSIIDESNVPVLWGDETKIVTEKQKIQEVFTINKDNKLSNYYYYEELQTNRDPYEPGNWYNTVKLVRREYKTINYSYNKRQEGHISYYNSL